MCNIPLLVKAISKSVHDMWGRHGKLINFQAKSVGMAKNKQNNNWHEDGCGFFLFLPKLKLASCQRGTSSLACFCHWILKFDNRIEWCAKWSIICLNLNVSIHISRSAHLKSNLKAPVLALVPLSLIRYSFQMLPLYFWDHLICYENEKKRFVPCLLLR